MSVSMLLELPNKLNVTNNKKTQFLLAENSTCIEKYERYKEEIVQGSKSINSRVVQYERLKKENPQSSATDLAKKSALNCINAFIQGINWALEDCLDGLDPDKIRELKNKLKELEDLKGQLNAKSIRIDRNTAKSKPSNPDFWGGAAQNLLGITKTTAEGFGQLFNATVGEALKSWSQNH
jgi:hypothetical protein